MSLRMRWSTSSAKERSTPPIVARVSNPCREPHAARTGWKPVPREAFQAGRVRHPRLSLPRKRLGGFVEERESAAVGLMEVFLREDLLGRAAGDDAHVQQHDVVEVIRHGLQVVMNDKRGPARVAQVVEDPDNRLLGSRVNAG